VQQRGLGGFQASAHSQAHGPSRASSGCSALTAGSFRCWLLATPQPAKRWTRPKRGHVPIGRVPPRLCGQQTNWPVSSRDALRKARPWTGTAVANLKADDMSTLLLLLFFSMLPSGDNNSYCHLYSYCYMAESYYFDTVSCNFKKMRTHTDWMCCRSVMFPSGHMTSLASVHPGEGSSSVALLKVSSLFFSRERFFYFLIVIPDPMWGPGTGMSYVYRL